MSVEKVRVFNEKGIELFRQYLHTLGENPKAAPPKQLLNNPNLCAEIGEVVKVEERSFTTRLDAAQYFSRVFSGVDKGNVDQNAGLWSWLSLYYFDHVCPSDAEGNRAPGRDYRHIPDRSYRYRHRHLLAGPYQAFQLYGDRAMILLCTPVQKENAFHHEIAGRQILMSNPAIMETVSSLYLDEKTKKPKFGSQSHGKPGTIRRFVDVMQQLDLTYDLYSMSPEQLLSLLPAEFDGWKGTISPAR